jgi:gliding motility-associated-like protein
VGTSRIQWIIEDDSGNSAFCFQNVIVTANSAGLTVDAGVDATICDTETYQLNGSVSSSSVPFEWLTTGTGTFDNANILNPVYTPGAEDIESGTVELIIHGMSGGTCGDSRDTMILTIDKQPAIFAGADASICGIQNYTLADATIDVAEAKVYWTTSGTGGFSDRTTINTTYIPSQGDIVNGFVELTVLYNQVGACSIVSDVMMLTILKQPEASAGSDVSTCFNQPVQILGATAYRFSYILWTANGTGVLENENTLSPTYVPGDGETGDVLLSMQVIGESVCTSDTIIDELLLTVYPELLIDAGDDDTIYINTSTELSVDVTNGSGRYYYQWEPAAFVKNDKAGFTETTNLEATTKYEVEVTDINTKCTVWDTKTVYVEDDEKDLVGIYNAFTPNGDGVNDFWAIRGIEKFPDNVVKLFNIWGDKVIELNHYDNVNIAWFGTNKDGKLLPDGTYYYVVTLTGVKSYSGWVQIKGSN